MDATRRSARGARTTVLWCAVCAVLSATTAGAATASLDVGAERSDNIARTPTNEQSETTATARGAFAMSVERPRLKGDIDADLRYRSYLDDSFDDELLGGASVDLALALIKDRFDWIVQDNFGQISEDRRAVETPDNRQNVNVFSTGPSIKLPLGARTALNVDGRWTDANYEDSVQNSESKEASIGLARKLSEQSTLGLYGSGSESEYEGDPLSQTFRIKSAYLKFDASGARTTLSVDGGYTEVSHGDVSNSGPLAHLTITRKVGAYSTLSLTAGTEFQDAAAQFRLDQAQIGLQDSNQDTVVAADVFRSNYVYLGFGTERDRSSFNITLNGTRERHEEQTNLDRDLLRAALSVGYRATQRVDLDLHGEYLDEEFVGPGSTAFKEWSFGAGVSFRLSPSISMRLGLDRYEGSSDDNTRDYQENRAYVGFGYTVGQH